MKLIRQKDIVVRENGHKEHHVEVIREIDSAEYRRFKEGKDNLVKYLKHITLYEAVIRNYKDYIHTIDTKLKGQFAGVDEDVIDGQETMLEFNRRFLNFIAMARLFLDHTETYISRRYGDKSHQYKRFKENTSSEFDNSFAYRFLYRLRNYALHCGMPIGRVSGSTKLDKSGESDVLKSELVIQFSRDQLLSDFNKWGTVEKELKAKPSYFGIIPICAEYLKSLSRIQDDFLQQERSWIRDSIEYLWLLYEEIGFEYVKQGIATVFEKTTNGLKMQIDWIPIKALERYFPRKT